MIFTELYRICTLAAVHAPWEVGQGLSHFLAVTSPPPPPFFLEVHVCCKMEEGGVTASQYGNTYYSGNGELATLAKCGNLCMIVHVIALPLLYCRK